MSRVVFKGSAYNTWRILMKSKTSATQEFAAKQSVRRTAEQSAVHDVYRSTTPPEKITDTSYINPVRNFYQENDFQISQRDEIQETYDQLYELSETITGDFDAADIAVQYRINKYGYIMNGAYAFKIRLNGSYKKYSLDYKSFCKEYLKSSYSKVRREMIASRVSTDLMLMGFDVLPSCVAQAEMLEHYYGEELYDIWKAVTDEYREDQITTTVIKSVIKKNEPIEEEPISIPVWFPRTLYHEIDDLGIELEKSVVDTVHFLYHEVYLYHTRPKSSNPGTEVLQKWQDWLHKLIHQTSIVIFGEPRIIPIE